MGQDRPPSIGRVADVEANTQVTWVEVLDHRPQVPYGRAHVIPAGVILKAGLEAQFRIERRQVAQLRADLRDLVGDRFGQVVFPETKAIAADAQCGGGAQQLLRVRLRNVRDRGGHQRQFLAPAFQGFDEPGQFVRRAFRFDLALTFGTHGTFHAVPANFGHRVGGFLEAQVLKWLGEADECETLFGHVLGEQARRSGDQRGGGGGRFDDKVTARE